jgi:hypothetical protein
MRVCGGPRSPLAYGDAVFRPPMDSAPDLELAGLAERRARPAGAKPEIGRRSVSHRSAGGKCQSGLL